jgi:response regulator RpfG family c-di-GMP phosphodiesterase
MRFLYIEDSVDNHFLIDFYLKSLSVDLVCIETIEDGMKLLDSEHFDGLFLDLNLPGKYTSWQLLEKLKVEKRLETLKIWVITAMQNHEVMPRIAAYKGVEFVRKPIKKTDFLKMIKEAFPETLGQD